MNVRRASLLSLLNPGALPLSAQLDDGRQAGPMVGPLSSTGRLADAVTPPRAAALGATAPQDADPDSAKTCGSCHKEFYEEWKGRAHSKAWVDPVYQAAIKEKEMPQLCHNCHIPEPVLDRLGRKPQTRKNLHDEGVNCVSCHKKGDAMHGPFGAKTDAHPTEKDPAFSEQGAVNLCASCHGTKIGPVLPVADDFVEAKMAEKGKSCTGCHMPEIERHLAVSPVTGKPVGEKRMTRSHVVLGPGDPEFCAKAFELSARKDGKDVVLVIANKAGHRVPGLTLRKFVVRAHQQGADGKNLSEQVVEISSENELRAEEAREFRFAAAADLANLRVQIDHVLEGTKQATVVDQTLQP